MELTPTEKITAIVYGDTFAAYNEAEFDEFIKPFYKRFEANGLLLETFKGMRCLDAGCGGGRASIFMAQNGAAEVVSLDMAPRNIASTTMRAKQKGFSHIIKPQQANLQAIPFDSESFDVVWCNGVLHHSEDPDKGLSEITRVLKQHGRLWLYLYGSGGIYWYVVDWIRELVKGIPVEDCIRILVDMKVPTSRIAERIDNWCVPYLRRYTDRDVTKRLDSLGYTVHKLNRGTYYDTSERRARLDDAPAFRRSEDYSLMGEGDLRYFCTKVGSQSAANKLPDPPDRKGSPYQDAPIVTQFGPILAGLKTGASPAEKVALASKVHGIVREMIETTPAFDAEAFKAALLAIAPTRR